MNSLSYAGTHQGDTMHWFGHAGHIFYFRTRARSATLGRVNVCDSVERRWDDDTDYEELPSAVRGALQEKKLEFRREASTVREAMV